ncbi:glycosyltransferase family 2 protein [Iodobacter arcticus]|uniref:Glycosyltransferase family 2 protein n=1 Tax=Iodobacter arcticus TaxID=590593 RepID=A0ABW2QWK5_9NEIS
MSGPLLSICIPTYNRYKYLKECLDSIIIQDNKDVEIVISDNASTDNTEELVLEYSKELSIKYQRFESNQGFDINCTKVVSMATGQYCMILGSDDCLLQNSIVNIKSILASCKPDVLHFGYHQYDLSMKILSSNVALSDRIAKIENLDDVADYIKTVPNLSLAFAFISSFIFLRSHWPSANQYQKWLGSQYVHLFCMHSIINQGCIIKTSDQAFVAARGGNINDATDQPGKILSLDLITFKNIVMDVYNSNIKVHKSFSFVFKKSYTGKVLLHTFCYGGDERIISRQKELSYFGYGNYIFLFKLLKLLKIKMVLRKMIECRAKLRVKE